MTKMTYAQALEVAINAVDDEVVKERLEALKEQLAKRNSRENKPTKTQKENVALCEDIWAYVSEDGAKRANEVAIHFGVSGQKASAMLKKLVDEGRLDKFIEKRITYFRCAEGV